MNNRYKSFQQGWTDACVHLGDDVPTDMLLDEPIDEGSEEMDALAYLQGQINALLDHVQAADKSHKRSADMVSCLANGILPD